MAVCQYFLKGTCRYGDKCRFNHPSPGRTVCQHFLRGNCRFGDRCRNEHHSGGTNSGFDGHHYGNTSHTSSYRWQSRSGFEQNRFGVLSGSDNSGTNTFGGQQKPISSQDAGQTPSQIQQTIKRDMENWDLSKQWPLSCYTYNSKEPCISGLTDCSPEELRLEAYKCNAEGKSAVYQQGLNELLGFHKQRRTQFSTMSLAQIHELVVKSSEEVAEDSGFSSVFQAAPEAGTSQGLFSSMTTSAAQPGVFGTGVSPGGSFPAQQSSGLFSSSSQTGGHMFGMTTPQASSQLFGSQPKSDDGSSMATEPSGFGTAPGSNQSVTTNVNAFSGSLNPGTTATVQFGSSGQGSTNASSHSTSAISQASASGYRYSDEDLAAFKAPMFTLGKIPECPPPMELC